MFALPFFDFFIIEQLFARENLILPEIAAKQEVDNQTHKRQSDNRHDIAHRFSRIFVIEQNEEYRENTHNVINSCEHFKGNIKYVSKVI